MNVTEILLVMILVSSIIHSVLLYSWIESQRTKKIPAKHMRYAKAPEDKPQQPVKRRSATVPFERQ